MLNTQFSNLFNQKDEVVEEKFYATKKMGVGGSILSLFLCMSLLAYFVYSFIFKMECIIYKGKKSNGEINWKETITTILLFAFCGPCMFVYRYLNRCSDRGQMGNNMYDISNNF